MFTCENCKQSFFATWSEEEQETESKQLWGEIPTEERATVCDDCFQKLINMPGLFGIGGGEA